MPELSFPIRTQRGAVVKVFVRSRAATLPAAAPPTTGPLAAYLDTGASVTVIDPGVVRVLGLEPVTEAGLHVLGRADVSFHALYDVEAALVTDSDPPRWVTLTALEGPVNPKGTAAVLGRDFLAHLILTYDGPAGRFAVRW